MKPSHSNNMKKEETKESMEKRLKITRLSAILFSISSIVGITGLLLTNLVFKEHYTTYILTGIMLFNAIVWSSTYINLKKKLKEKIQK